MLRRNLVLSFASMPILLPQVKAAGADAVAQALIDVDPRAQQAIRNQKKLQEDFLKAYDARRRQEAARVDAQNRIMYETAEIWTQINPETPKTGLELAAQAFRLSYNRRNITAESKQLAEAIPDAVNSFFTDYSPVLPVNNIDVHTVRLVISVTKDLMFTPRSKCKTIQKSAQIGWDEYFDLWKAYPKTIDLLTPEYVASRYHPVSTAGLYNVSQYVHSAINFYAIEYQKYVERFNKDPLNKVRKNQPLKFWDYVGTKTRWDSVTSNAWTAFKKKFPQKTIDKTKQAIIDYATMKTLKLQLPKEVESYLNS